MEDPNEIVAAILTMGEKETCANSHVWCIDDDSTRFLKPQFDALMRALFIGLTGSDGKSPKSVEITVVAVRNNEEEESEPLHTDTKHQIEIVDSDDECINDLLDGDGGLQSDVVNDLIEEYTEEIDKYAEEIDNICDICYESVSLDNAYVYNCDCKNHLYHVECGLKYFQSKRKWVCPTCRKSFKDEDYAFVPIKDRHKERHQNKKRRLGTTNNDNKSKRRPLRCHAFHVVGSGCCRATFSTLRNLFQHIYKKHYIPGGYTRSHDFRHLFDCTHEHVRGHQKKVLHCKYCEKDVCATYGEVEDLEVQKKVIRHLNKKHNAHYLRFNE
jgi:hypothetical protein